MKKQKIQKNDTLQEVNILKTKSVTQKEPSMKQQVQNLKGFRDFLPEEKRARDFVAATIATVFQTFGFEPLETPTLEYASLLLGKYGDEADKLVYSFQDRGDREVALRYDQTVPTSRVLAQYQNELPKYFRRYQIQNVFRADKPQKGRFREFTQCDCDIFESSSPLVDAELLAVYYSVYKKLGITSIQLKINDRQTLMDTISPFAIPEADVFSIIQSVDKLDKLSLEDVTKELVQKGLSAEDATQVLTAITSATQSENLQQIIAAALNLGVPENALVFTPTLARGLDYYTGMIFEGSIPEYTAGSVGGGGRYDNLIGELCGRDIAATGFAIGFDRTVEAVQQLGLLPSELNTSSKVLVTLFDEASFKTSLETATRLREAGIATEIYPTFDKLGKQFKVADQKNIPYVIIIGETELSDGTVTLKNMKTGEQKTATLAALLEDSKTF
ncbi:MAG: histidine--tRNA ligase [Candidatus Pacebacteria bacterium]|nr:histidine--tRNA ligase [Candidatus Paceibacterota bacterium]PIR63372.1 MAG: histidine--tRNA ligase [Candidatus Pacebacteria bacterium CG10_big_fil_rev_8_21_14_0_10_40_26]PIZ79120.1 MAG: histidine--tRNA ligase [Candidatus Pacebacteria bacterium CG_4_10_14_0_2_um_filter_40_20]PJA69192.1 MAG: histidine--tRNA ligase [Candidatus Pacebacteria bacterium CG_4_9_14_3_um_filter_40_12]PJC42086.1 MAG: histidine--tRNA ligase [Candidatus Pacebacteria bacterium CG_4_9_14_0_2_um_filter_40_15]